ncbi:mechanosensitive ion channel [Suttonella sp. R2A3]|uniref:mechanosensitive ion channel domain-containing protein n=1 Tax=Suttonella sp. R2A3 TaxID=2908648 RepID=UPI001F24DE1C|nr:mechanosensitive ion channel domain-containing protein [Suttonella sp. R2A3]UJF24138.1 mechanosensitive ion channel [Suttonella sp. R2A3]
MRALFAGVQSLIFIVLWFSAQSAIAQQSGMYDTVVAASSAQIEVAKEEITSLEEQIVQLQNNIKHITEALNNPASSNAIIKQGDLNQARIELEQEQLRQDNQKNRLITLDKTIEDTKATTQQINTQLQKLANPLATNDNEQNIDQETLQNRLERNERYHSLLQEKRKRLNHIIELDRQYVALLSTRYQRYNERYLENDDARRNSSEAPSDLESQSQQLIKERDRLNMVLRDSSLNSEQRLHHNILIAILNKQIMFNAIGEEVSQIEQRMQELQFVDFSSVSLERIRREQSELEAFRSRLNDANIRLDNNFTTIKDQYELFSNQKNGIPELIAQQYADMQRTHQDIGSALDNNLFSVALLKEKIDGEFTTVSKNYLKRQFRFGGSIMALPQIAQNITTAFGTFAGQYLVSAKTLLDALKNMPLMRWVMLTVAVVAIILVTISVTIWNNRLSKRYRKHIRMGFAPRFLLFIFGMLKHNFPYIGFLLLSLTLVHVAQLSAPSYGLLLLPAILMLMIAIPYFAMRILIDTQLLETTDNYRVVRIVGILSAIGSILFALVMMAEQILNDQTTIDTFRWIYGVYIALVTLPMWHAINRAVSFLNGYYSEFYTYRILRVVVYIIPIGFTLFTISSLLGYLNFAWLSAQYLLYLLLVALIWIGFLALCKDASLWAKRYALLNTNNGVFWAQDVIGPLHTILRYGSLLLLAWLLLRIYGWNSHTPVLSDFLTLLKKPLFSSSTDSQFTLMNILLMALLIYIVFRIGSWLKSFSYRWIYSKVVDLGIRNSLAVFSQYAAVTFGFLLALRIIGLDLTTFTVLAGAIGVGIGFGMQTIANNFISGILLLIERPLRSGDIISVGGYDGTVERIGMRSLTMTTFDNESVILPNSDFVTSAFKNWSHTDQLKRMVLYFDISYRHDPAEVEGVLMNELQEMLALGELSDQEPYMKNRAFAFGCSERGITYRVQYYWHLLDHDFATTRHKLITRIWQACKRNGFEIAYLKHDIYFPEHQDQDAHKVLPLPFAPPHNHKNGE